MNAPQLEPVQVWATAALDREYAPCLVRLYADSSIELVHGPCTPAQEFILVKLLERFPREFP